MEVNVRHQSIRWKYDHDTWVTRLPAEGLRVFVRVGPSVAPLEFSLDQSVPNQFDDKGHGEWELKDQVLPYQGFTLHWFPVTEGTPPDLSREAPGSGEYASADESTGARE